MTEGRCAACTARGDWCWLRDQAGDCPRVADPTWAEYNRLRSALPPPAPAPAAPPPPGPGRLSVIRARELWARMKACPHRGPHSCGCGALATCSLGKGSAGTVDHHDCCECLLARDREGPGG